MCRGIDLQMSLCEQIKASRTPRDTPKQAPLQTIRTKTHSSKLSAATVLRRTEASAARTGSPHLGKRGSCAAYQGTCRSGLALALFLERDRLHLRIIQDA